VAAGVIHGQLDLPDAVPTIPLLIIDPALCAVPGSRVRTVGNRPGRARFVATKAKGRLA
jgi:hypothetical protein